MSNPKTKNMDVKKQQRPNILKKRSKIRTHIAHKKVGFRINFFFWFFAIKVKNEKEENRRKSKRVEETFRLRFSSSTFYSLLTPSKTFLQHSE